MYPILYQCRFFTIYTYGVFVALAFFVTTWLLIREARRRHMDEDMVSNFCLVLLISGIVGARIFYIVLNWSYFQQDLKEIVMLQHGGLVWFGGFIGAFITGLIFIRLKKKSVLTMLDLLSPYVALAQAIGRIGCFFNGCCYGKEMQGGVYFPSQLVDSFTLLIVFVVLKLIQRTAWSGKVFVFYVLLASLQRFLMEFIRGDDRPFYHHLSNFQWMSVGLFFGGLFLYTIFLWKRKAV